jgi:hypothetical protein
LLIDNKLEMHKQKNNNYFEEFEGISSSIFLISNLDDFEKLACRIFNLQYKTNKVYKTYVDLLNIDYSKVNSVKDIPFIPISFFKKNRIISGDKEEKLVFYSSGTTSGNRSKHYITNPELYRRSFINSFNYFYGNPSKYCFLALLPGYLEREGSSLIYMVKELMTLSNHPKNGFYLNEYGLLKQNLTHLKEENQAYILIGVTYALLDFANLHPLDLKDGIVMETGGMKGKRKEMIKNEVHDILKSSFNLETIDSEYGMTELLSQAYSKGDGLYNCPPWMKVMIRDIYDPFNYVPNGTSGGINIIDLANLNSCSFIETQDLGRICENGCFEILGRFDNSEIRGCNLLIS